MQDVLKAKQLIPFLNQKNKSDMKFNNEGLIERKEAIVNKVETIDEQEGTVWCTISTQNVDRMGDVVLSEGVNTEEFKKIPSVYINHDYSLLPIAKCEEIIHAPGEIRAKMKFVLSVPVIKNIFELVKAGAMKGISIGFDASEILMRGTKNFDDMCKSLKMDVANYEKTRRIITKWNLYEFSLVSIPANAECFVKSLQDGKQEVSPELVKYLGIKSIEKEDEDEKPEKEDPKEDEVVDKKESEADTNVPSVIEKDLLNDGMAKEKGISAKDVDSEQLKMGKVVEMEHTKDEAIAERIALDHLSEHKDYYSKLATLFKDVEEETEAVEEEKKVVVPEVKQIKRYIKVIKTKEDVENEIAKTVEARLKGRTRLEIKIKE